LENLLVSLRAIIQDGEYFLTEKLETTAQGRCNILGIDALLVSTSVGTMTNGIFMGEVASIFTTMDGETIMSKGIAVGYPSGNGGATRAASIHITLSQKLARVNKVVGMQRDRHE
jgi:hypothetical protein